MQRARNSGGSSGGIRMLPQHPATVIPHSSYISTHNSLSVEAQLTSTLRPAQHLAKTVLGRPHATICHASAPGSPSFAG
eukprot:15433223-Alexandrium_andersonii.AAC.1